MKPILLLTGTEDCVRLGHPERVAVYPHRMTVTDRHYWTNGRVVNNAAPRAAAGPIELARIAHDDGTHSTLVYITGDLLPDGRDVAQLSLQVYDHSPDTMYAALRHWHGSRAHGSKALSNTIFRMDARSHARWQALTTWLKAQPNHRAALSNDNP